jgi:hypothetical protein
MITSISSAALLTFSMLWLVLPQLSWIGDAVWELLGLLWKLVSLCLARVDYGGSLVEIGQPYRQKLILQALTVLSVPFFLISTLRGFTIATVRHSFVRLHADHPSRTKRGGSKASVFRATRLE